MASFSDIFLMSRKIVDRELSSLLSLTSGDSKIFSHIQQRQNRMHGTVTCAHQEKILLSVSCLSIFSA